MSDLSFISNRQVNQNESLYGRDALSVAQESSGRLSQEFSQPRAFTVPDKVLAPRLTPDLLPSGPGSDSIRPIFFGSPQEYMTFGGVIGRRLLTPEVSGGLATVGGAVQGIIDFQRLRNSESLLQTSKYSAGLLTDAGMVSGGLLTALKFGPKYLGPALMAGGLAGRILLDLVPDKTGGK